MVADEFYYYLMGLLEEIKYLLVWFFILLIFVITLIIKVELNLLLKMFKAFDIKLYYKIIFLFWMIHTWFLSLIESLYLLPWKHKLYTNQEIKIY